MDNIETSSTITDVRSLIIRNQNLITGIAILLIIVLIELTGVFGKSQDTQYVIVFNRELQEVVFNFTCKSLYVSRADSYMYVTLIKYNFL